jgi:cytochrome c553
MQITHDGAIDIVQVTLRIIDILVVGSEKSSVALGGYEVAFYGADTIEVRWRCNYFVSQTYEKNQSTATSCCGRCHGLRAQTQASFLEGSVTVTQPSM